MAGAMNVLWMSNAPWVGTGYGKQTQIVLKAIKERGLTPSCFCFYGLAGGVVEYDGYKCLPGTGYDPWGNDVIRAHTERTNADMVVSLLDLFVLEPSVWQKLPLPWVAWVPIDSDTIGDPTLQRLGFVDFPVAMSHHGAEQMRLGGVEPAAVIYHAVDTDIYQPMDKWECRKEFGIDEDCYLVGMVMANKGDRKQYPAQFAAVRQWMEEHQDRDIKLFIHTEPTAAMGGWDMKALAAKLGLRGRIYATNQYDSTIVPLPDTTMAKIYNSMDVLMNCSAGEGFGIPIIEAQACGVPVLATAATAMKEIVWNGYLVKPQNRYLAAHYGFQYHPSIEDMIERLECAYRVLGKKQAEAGRAWVVANCSIPAVADAWTTLLVQVAQVGKPQITLREPVSDEDGKIAAARAALTAESDAYGTYNERLPEYDLVFGELLRMGMKKGARVLDLGAAYGDLGRYMFEKGWHGVYVPVDMTIDGTDLTTYQVPNGYDFIVLEQVIEHIEDWQGMLDQVESKGVGVVVVTPNKAVVGEGDKATMADQMAHVSLLSREDLEARGYTVSTYSFSTAPNDTIVATKVGATDGVHGHSADALVSG